MRWVTDGVALGTQECVEKLLMRYPPTFGPKLKGGLGRIPNLETSPAPLGFTGSFSPVRFPEPAYSLIS